MANANVYRLETDLPLAQFVAALQEAAAKRDFHIHNQEKMDMRKNFIGAGLTLADDFDVHLIQLCKPQKAAASLSTNPERAPFIPKFVAAFTQNGKTQVRLLRFGEEMVAELVDDPAFPKSLAESFDVMVELIEEAADSATPAAA